MAEGEGFELLIAIEEAQLIDFINSPFLDSRQNRPTRVHTRDVNSFC